MADTLTVSGLGSPASEPNPGTEAARPGATRPEAIQIVTLADSRYLTRDYVEMCVRSWRRIARAARPFWVLDAGLDRGDHERARELGLELPHEYEARIEGALANFPELRRIRTRFITWRKLIDATVLFRNAGRVLFIDTDAYVVVPIEFPDSLAHFVYQCDDVPAYRGGWSLPLREPMVVSLNAGFMLWTPAKVDLEHLERLTATYFAGAKKMWWTVQAAWSAIVAASGSFAMFDGRDVRTFSGNRKRTRAEIEGNAIKMVGRSGDLTTEAEARALLDGAAVIHFAGHGKSWLKIASSMGDDRARPRVVRSVPIRPASPLQRLMIAGRMLAVELWK